MDNKNILIVDDEASVRRFLKDVFTAEGFYVFEAAEGDEALKKLKQNSIEVAVMDLRMPGRDGLETLKEIKLQNIETKVIMMTGYATVKTAVEAMKHGAFDYIVKPFENDELVDIVKAAISGTKKTKHSRRKGLIDQGEDPSSDIIGRSPAMAEIYKIGRAAIAEA